jgi:hypothetical protein
MSQDPIAIQHAENLKRGLYHKTMFMAWRKCKYFAVVNATEILAEIEEFQKQPRIWLKVGKDIHTLVDSLHQKADGKVMSTFFHVEAVKKYLWELLQEENPPGMYEEYLRKVVSIESQRWMVCMRKSMPKMRMRDWKVALRETYIEQPQLKMALNVDRLERVPGTTNQYALIEWKAKVNINDIRQELAWYYTGLEPWVAHHNRVARQKFGFMTPEKLEPYLMHITHWGAFGYNPESDDLYEQVKKISLTYFRKAFAEFLEDMGFAKNYKGTIDNIQTIYEGIMKKPLRKIMVDIMCNWCELNGLCYTKRNLLPILYRQQEIDDGLLSQSDLMLYEELKDEM